MIENKGKWSINSERRIRPGGAHAIIYEWEDVLASYMGIQIEDRGGYCKELVHKVTGRLGLNFSGRFRRNKSIAFKICAISYSDWSNSPDIIPCIIDYYIPRNDYRSFFKATSRNRIVFISSMEVYEALTKHFLFDNKKYFHLPLTIPDKYKLKGNESFKKGIDLIMPGRPDSLLINSSLNFELTNKK